VELDARHPGKLHPAGSSGKESYRCYKVTMLNLATGSVVAWSASCQEAERQSSRPQEVTEERETMIRE